MKKILTVLFAAMFGIAALSSCVKVRTCTCVTTTNEENGEVSTQEYPVNGNKKTAQNSCSALNKVTNSYTTVCNMN